MGFSNLDTIGNRPEFIKKFIQSYGKTEGDILAADASETSQSAKINHQGWTIPAGGNDNANAMRETVIAMNIASDIGTDDDSELGLASSYEHAGEYFNFYTNGVNSTNFDLYMLEVNKNNFNTGWETYLNSVVAEGSFDPSTLAWSAERTITIFIPYGNFSSINSNNKNDSLPGNNDIYIVADIKGALAYGESSSASNNYTVAGGLQLDINAADQNGGDSALSTLFNSGTFYGMGGPEPFYCEIWSGIHTSLTASIS